jgi:hypothetical protein
VVGTRCSIGSIPSKVRNAGHLGRAERRRKTAGNRRMVQAGGCEREERDNEVVV